MTLFPSTKTKLRDSIHAGHLIYVPSRPFTYQSWTGLVYIDLDPNTGFGGYIIGEGLNGGFTAVPVAQWPSGLLNLLINKTLNNLTATILLPTPGQQFTKGQEIQWQAQYNGTVAVIGTPIHWTENLQLDSSPWPVGNVTIPSGYNTAASVDILLKYPTRLGTSTPQYDDIIIKYSDKYNIPASLLKSLIRQENGPDFNPRSYRYEPCVDYSLFSNSDPVRGLSTHPYHHFRLAGQDILGDAFTEGDQVSNLDPDPKIMASSFTSYSLSVTDNNNDGNLTVAELWANNNSVQHWSNYCDLTELEKNFTAQLLLSASYGLTHVLYDTAITQGFDQSTEGIPATNIYDLFEPDVSIRLAASYLKDQYDVLTTLPDSCSNGGRWWQSLRRYNGGPRVSDSNQIATNYANSVCKFYNSQRYDIIQ